MQAVWVVLSETLQVPLAAQVLCDVGLPTLQVPFVVQVLCRVKLVLLQTPPRVKQLLRLLLYVELLQVPCKASQDALSVWSGSWARLPQDPVRIPVCRAGNDRHIDVARLGHGALELAEQALGRSL